MLIRAHQGHSVRFKEMPSHLMRGAIEGGTTGGDPMAIRWHSDSNPMAIRWHSDGNLLVLRGTQQPSVAISSAAPRQRWH